MSSRDLVDPELLSLLDIVPTGNINENTLPLVRAMPPLKPPPVDLTPGVELAGCTIRTIPSYNDGAKIDLYIYQPCGLVDPAPCIYHMHGGGFIMGSASEMTPINAALAAALNCVIVSVDYRLAPEIKFPGNINDCYAGLAWVFDNADVLSIDKTRIGVKGESAGGGLAAAISLMARDKGKHQLAFQHLIYPMLDDQTCLRAPSRPAVGEFIWTNASNDFAWSALLGRPPGADNVSPYASPARAKDLSGLPLTYISCGELDLFFDENAEFSSRLAAHGVAVEFIQYPGAFHAFDAHRNATVAQKARVDSLTALRHALSL